MRRCEFLRKLEEIKGYYFKIMDILKKLEEEGTTLITKEGIVKLFEKDANSIKEDYEKGKISRKEAQKLLEDLQEVNDELEKYISYARELFLELETYSHSILRKLIEPPHFGVPVAVVKKEVEEVINRRLGKSIPKRGFGILELSNLSESECRQKIHEFLYEHSSGLVIAQPELGECVAEILGDVHVRFEVKKVEEKVVFIMEGK